MKRILFIVTALIYIVSGCKEEDRLDHIDDSASAPAQVIEPKAINIQGGAIIKYRIPKDNNLLAVKAVYNRNGEICETRASFYCDSLVVEGLSDTTLQTVNLYSVGRNEKLSEPKPVEIKPHTPPVKSVEFDIIETFGGVKVSFGNNVTRAPLALVVLIDSIGDGKWEHLRTFYVEAIEGTLLQKEMNSRKSKFALHIRDRWLNCSDTIVKTLTPVAELKLPKTTWTKADFPGDAVQPLEDLEWHYGLHLLWEEDREFADWGAHSFGNASSSPMPQHFTVAFGYRATLSSFKIWPRQQTGQGEQEMYRGRFPRIFELWGAENPPSNDSFDGWTLLGRWEVFKPSGYNDDSTVGVVNGDDKLYFENNQLYNIDPGEEFPDPYIPVTHIRFRTIHSFETYPSGATNGSIIISEMTFYGQELE
jgi:hypothetical protein